VSSVNFLELQTPQELVKRAPPAVRPPTPTSALGVAKRLGLKDPLFTEQWHLVNDEFPEHMMNTTPVWDMGFTGEGVITSFLDDGLDFETDDLKDAFVSLSAVSFFWAICSSIVRMLIIPMTSMPMCHFLVRRVLETTTEHGVLARLLQEEMRPAGLASPTT
jgi:hypothetical protein